MNERIQELVEQANLTEVIDDAYQERNDWQPFVEKFTELIVKECLLFTNPSPHEGTEFGEALAWADKNIREHFGVVK